MFAYTATSQKTENGSQTSNPRRTLLNKRVAFPLSGSIQPSAPLSASGPPPIGAPPLSNYSVAHSSHLGEGSTVNNDQHMSSESSTEASLAKVKRILQQKSTDINLQPSKHEEISKQIHKLLTSWEIGKFNDDIQQRLVKLCDSLEGDNLADAESIQVALAVDYTSECSTWILAIKNIIAELNEGLKS